MLINKVYNAVNQLVNKDQAGGFIPPAEFNVYADLAQYDYIHENYNPLSKYGYEATSKNSDEFSNLKKTATIPVSNGSATKPSDYLHFSSAYVYGVFNDAGSVRVAEMIRDDEWPQRVSSEVDKPSLTFPVIRSIDGAFQVVPSTAPQLMLNYIKKPLSPWWNYTSSSYVPVFAETSGVTQNPNDASFDSTDFDIPESAFSYLVFKISRYFGISVREADVYQLIDMEAKNEH
jgi:hypothetical protein